MTIHVIGFVHTRLDDVAFSHCAFTSKVCRWVEMMSALGEDISVYWGGEENTAKDYGQKSYVSLMSNAEQEERFGVALPNTILNLDWNPDAPHWRVLNHRVSAALYTNWHEGDVIAVLSGSNHDGLMDEWPHATFIEPWIGYAGISMKSKAKCFESSAWRHYLYGNRGIGDGVPLDVVIPNFYRPDDFYVGSDEGYLLFVGRMIQRKGVETVVEVARRMNLPLIIAGQGAHVDEQKLVCDDGTVMDCSDASVTYLGIVGPVDRAKLYAEASATIVATTYIEPFGGVFAEAMLSGVQPACRNWGAFVEYVTPDFRFDDVNQATGAVARAILARSPEIRDEAIRTFSMERCALQYAAWLNHIRDTMAE